jgi:hypothetical protein
LILPCDFSACILVLASSSICLQDGCPRGRCRASQGRGDQGGGVSVAGAAIPRLLKVGPPTSPLFLQIELSSSSLTERSGFPPRGSISFVPARKSVQNGPNWCHYRTSFAKRSCVGFFPNERTQSSPFDPKLIFWGVSDCFVTARKSVQNGPNWVH